MTFGVRGGSFGTPGRGPFRAGGGGISGNYSIGDSALQTASLDKYAAQTAWNNGTISDNAYLGALQKYLNVTSPGSRERISAQNELSDARYQIGRNDIVRRVNGSTSPSGKIGALNDLVAYDRNHLRGMSKDNQQTEDLVAKIADTQAQIRTTRYNALMTRYNNGALSTEAMIAMAERNARESQGQQDGQDWANTLVSLQQRKADENYAAVYQDWNMGRADGSAVVKAMDARLAFVTQDSPQYQTLQRERENLVKDIQTKDWRAQDANMTLARQNGTVSEEGYLQYLMGVIQRYADGTPEKKQAKANFVDASFNAAEKRLTPMVEAGDPAASGQLLNLYQTRIATLDPNSALALSLQQDILKLQLSANSNTPLYGSTLLTSYIPQGHWITPGGTPTNNAGFASQFDGSAFANQNCLMASTAMLAWAVSNGDQKVSGGDMRYYSGDAQGGTNPPDAVTALRAIGIKASDQHVDLPTMLRMLANGTPLAVTGNTANLPQEYKIGSFSGLHGIFAQTAKKDKNGNWFVYIKDPQGRAGYNGQWWPAEVMNAFAYAPNSTNGWVVSAGRSSSLKGAAPLEIGQQDTTVPFQAFDTDYNGNSTIGRGGGTSPQEAGPVQDWSKGKPTHATGPVIGTDDRTAQQFLAAVHRVEQNGQIADPWNPAESLARAKMFLGEYGGDARLAAVAWFMGDANPDSSKWTQQDRFYANAVGTSLGYQKIPDTGIGIVSPQNAAPSVGTTPGTGPGTTKPLTTQTKSNYYGEQPKTPAEQIGFALLEQLGAPVTPDMVRAIEAWVGASNGVSPDTTQHIDYSNPFNLKAQSTSVYGGIASRDPDGTLHFKTWQDAVNAVAQELRTDHPDLVGAINTGQPDTFLSALDGSTWQPGGYAGTLAKTYNQLPGATLIGGSPLKLNTPSDMSQLAHTYPDLGDLFTLDPRDPVQKQHFDTNLKAMQLAAAKKSSSFIFTTPSGQQITMPFQQSYLDDMVQTNLAYAHAQDPGPGASPEDRAKYQQNVLKPATDLAAASGVDHWQSAMDAYDKMATQALGMGDYTTYANIRMRQVYATDQALGIDPNDPNGTITNGGLTQTQLSQMTSKLGSLSPQVTDQNSPSYNPKGDQVLGLIARDPSIAVKTVSSTGLVTYSSVVPKPDQAYVGMDKTGNPKLITSFDTPSDFTPVEGPNGVPYPTYVVQNVQIDGMWVPKTKYTVNIVQASNGADASIPTTVSQVDVPAAITVDPATGQQTIYLSLDGSFSQNLVYKPSAVGTPQGPALILSGNGTGSIDPQTGNLVYGYGGATQTYNANSAPPGTLAQLVHWAGTDPQDIGVPAGSQGASGVYMPIIGGPNDTRTQPNALGGTSIDSTQTPDELWRQGELTIPQYRALAQQRIPMTAAITAAQSGFPGLAPYAAAVAGTFQRLGIPTGFSDLPPGFVTPPGVVGTPSFTNFEAPIKSTSNLPQMPSTMPSAAYGVIAAANASQQAAQLRLVQAQQRQAAQVAAQQRAQQVAQQQQHYADLNTTIAQPKTRAQIEAPINPVTPPPVITPPKPVINQGGNRSGPIAL